MPTVSQSAGQKPRVLWLISVTLPEAARLFGLTGAIGGGWVLGQLNALKKDAQITVCTVNSAAKAPLSAESDGVRYVILPTGSREEFAALLKQEAPGLVQIWGSEYPPAANLLPLCDPARTLLSVQGLMGPCAEHLLDGVPPEFCGSGPAQRLVDRFVPGGLLDKQQAFFTAQAAREKALLAGLRHVSGRTAWDKAELARLAPNARYWPCNETLRPEFYTEEWVPGAFAATGKRAVPAACPAPEAPAAPHGAPPAPANHTAPAPQKTAPTLLLSQGNYPLKGLHRLIEALPRVCAAYPGTRLMVAGWPPLDKGRLLRPVIRWMFPYQRCCADLAARLGVAEHIHYTGPLNAEAMKRQYLAADLYLLCSSIENSPNSLGEAMLLGLPCIASRVGGVPSLLADGREGLLYPADDPEALADAILALLADPARAAALGAAARRRALVTHDPVRNAAAMLGIYRGILAGAPGPAEEAAAPKIPAEKSPAPPKPAKSISAGEAPAENLPAGPNPRPVSGPSPAGPAMPDRRAAP